MKQRSRCQCDRMKNERDIVPVALGPELIVTIPLADAVVEYFRLNGANNRSADEERVLAALNISMGTLITGSGAEQLYAALREVGDSGNINV